MKIALISTPFLAVPPRDYGGTELVVYELAEGLVARGHDVTLFATGDSRSSARLEALYPEAQWPPDSLADANHVSWALARVADSEYDIIHLHTAEGLPLARLLPAPPVVYTLHHARDEELSRFYQHFPWVWFVAISERQQELEGPLPRITTIHHGVDPALYLGPTRAGDFVCFIGRLSQIKGPHIAIDVAERAGVRIQVAGRCHHDDADPTFAPRELEPRLSRPHVRYLGAIGIDQKAPMLREARALLVPISWEEPFGLIMVEAMFSGCPVVAFPRGSAPELVEDGTTGFLVQDADDMVEVVRTRLVDFDRERCRARAIERFGRERMVEAYEAYYRRALRARPREVTFPLAASA